MPFKTQYERLGKAGQRGDIHEDCESSEILLQDFEPLEDNERRWKAPRAALPWIIHGILIAVSAFLFLSAVVKESKTDCLKRHKAYCERGVLRG